MTKAVKLSCVVTSYSAPPAPILNPLLLFSASFEIFDYDVVEGRMEKPQQLGFNVAVVSCESLKDKELFVQGLNMATAALV